MEQISTIKELGANAIAYLTQHGRTILITLAVVWLAIGAIRMFSYRLSRGDGFLKALAWAITSWLLWPRATARSHKQYDEDVRRRRERPPGNLTDGF